MLADGGVCILDNITSCKRDVREALQKGKHYLCPPVYLVIYFIVLETDEIEMNLLRQFDAHVSGNHDKSWKLNCTVWAQVDQQLKKKQYANADSHVIGECSVQVGTHTERVTSKQFNFIGYLICQQGVG